VVAPKQAPVAETVKFSLLEDFITLGKDQIYGCFILVKKTDLKAKAAEKQLKELIGYQAIH